MDGIKGFAATVGNGDVSWQCLVFSLLSGIPTFPYLVVYVIDICVLSKGGVYDKTNRPFGWAFIVAILPVVGVPYSFIKRRRDVRAYCELGGKTLGAWYWLSHILYGIALGVWGFGILCGLYALYGSIFVW
jgi:hypothetical protein